MDTKLYHSIYLLNNPGIIKELYVSKIVNYWGSTEIAVFIPGNKHLESLG